MLCALVSLMFCAFVSQMSCASVSRIPGASVPRKDITHKCFAAFVLECFVALFTCAPRVRTALVRESCVAIVRECFTAFVPRVLRHLPEDISRLNLTVLTALVRWRYRHRMDDVVALDFWFCLPTYFWRSVLFKLGQIFCMFLASAAAFALRALTPFIVDRLRAVCLFPSCLSICSQVLLDMCFFCFFACIPRVLRHLPEYV